MGHHVDQELRHGACRTLDRGDRAGLVEEVGQVGDVHQARVSAGTVQTQHIRAGIAIGHCCHVPGAGDRDDASKSEPTIGAMPSRTSPDNLASFIRQLDAATLSLVRGSVLLIDDRFSRPEVLRLLPSWWNGEEAAHESGFKFNGGSGPSWRLTFDPQGEFNAVLQSVGKEQ